MRPKIFFFALLFAIAAVAFFMYPSKEMAAHSAVEMYVRETMVDPSTYESVEFGKLKGGPDIFTIAHSYKEKSPSGETVLREDVFVLNKSCLHAISVKKNNNDMADLEWAIRWNNSEAR